MRAELTYHLNPTLQNGLTKRRVRHDLTLLGKAPNIEAIHVYPDINQELPGVGVPVGVSLLTVGSDPHVYPTAVTDANDGYRLIRLNVRSDELHACGAKVLAVLESLRNPWRILRPNDIDTIVMGGLQALEGFGFPELPGEPMRVADQGRVLMTNPNVLHPLARHALENFAGQFGSYGHFLEFLALETPVASLGMEREDVLLVIHGGAMQASEHVFWDAYFNFAQVCAEDGLDSELIISGLSSLPISHRLAINLLPVLKPWSTQVTFGEQSCTAESLLA